MEASEIKFEKDGHATYESCYITSYYDKQLQVGKYIEVGRNHSGVPTNRIKERFFIEGFTKEFKTIDEMIEAYNRINNIS